MWAQKHSKSVNGDIERLMVNRADGKLSIMKALKEDKPATDKAKPTKGMAEADKR